PRGAAWWWWGSSAPVASPPEVVEEAPADDAAGEEGEDPALPGKWRRARKRPDLTPEQEAEIARLEAIGYADGTEAVGRHDTITVHDRTRAWEGLNLYNSGHASEAILTDMDGVVLHTWRARWADVFPDQPVKPGAPGTNHWRRVKLLPDGSVLAIFEGRGMVRVDLDGRVLWSAANKAHHDLAIVGDRLLVLTREADLAPALDPKRPILQDFVETRSLDGALVERFSLLDALLASDHADLVRGKPHDGDLFHTNSIERLDGRYVKLDPAFREGNLLVSMRNLDAIGVVDPQARRFVWLLQGGFRKQHDANLTAQGVALFDNAGLGRWSRGLVVDPRTGEPVWSYAGSAQRPFRSATLGTIQVLPNRDVLLTESDGGRAIEVQPDGTIVWEMYNPHRAGHDGELIAALFEVVRLDPSEVAGWLKR
ncbi:MAG TPA: arylsulfotransferase family protein, partial [Myxococcota bacterium]|nr:arylsulfotransferase family protein [Myxococcota bacterium]